MLHTENLASPPHEVVGFYRPGVLAILIQHLAVGLASIVLVRERPSVAYEFFGITPLGPGKLLAGQYLAYCWLVLGANLVVAVLLSNLLGIPVDGDVSRIALAIVLATSASLGLGFLIFALAGSDKETLRALPLSEWTRAVPGSVAPDVHRGDLLHGGHEVVHALAGLDAPNLEEQWVDRPLALV